MRGLHRSGRGALLRRLSEAALTMVLMVAMVFSIPRLAPGDPLDQLIGDDPSVTVDPETRQELAAHYGLGKSLPAQFGRFIGGLAEGDLGWSLSKHDDVTTVIADRLPWTLLIVGPSLVLSTAIGAFAGVFAAWRHGRRSDRFLVAGFAALRSVPEFVVATVVLVAFSIWIPLFPLSGAQTPFRHDSGWLAAWRDIGAHAVLPIAALTLALVGTKFAVARGSMLSVVGSPFLMAARAKGLPRRRVRYVHGSRHAVHPVLAHVGAQVSFAVAGAVFVETVFAYPGLGALSLDAMATRDYALLDGCFLLLGSATILVNTVVDLVAWRFDPWGRR